MESSNSNLNLELAYIVFESELSEIWQVEVEGCYIEDSVHSTCLIFPEVISQSNPAHKISTESYDIGEYYVYFCGWLACMTDLLFNFEAAIPSTYMHRL